MMAMTGGVSTPEVDDDHGKRMRISEEETDQMDDDMEVSVCKKIMDLKIENVEEVSKFASVDVKSLLETT
ncbi:hypothetical protein FF38_06832 [Lucilia cuprina]|uniref:Uncharacterized protein n=1 Tax=Lucilia cuprina TaxID=7375 RepID=A0A0L0C6Z9_LUCCU|nr:hypothetical protein FF38_06832 [Lucilia cuprina]